MLLMTVIMVVRRVLAKPTVTIQSIYGALSAYLIIGLMFAACYAAIEHLGESAFFANDQPANTQTFQYFSFTTLTTLGYGDFTAAENGGRAVAVLEAMTGQVFLATLVARLVTAYRAPDPRPGPGGPAGAGYLRMLTALETTRIATSSEIASSVIIMSFAQGLIAETSVGLNAVAVVNERWR